MALVHLEHVTKRFGADRPPATDGLSFTVESGRILALLGPSGCGKTTTLRLDRRIRDTGPGPDRDRRADGRRRGPGDSRGARGAGRRRRLPGLRALPYLTIAPNVGFGLERTSRSERRTRVAQVLDLVSLTDFAERYPHELSGGQQQRAAVARALAPAPTLILLDEPFSK